MQFRYAISQNIGKIYVFNIWLYSIAIANLKAKHSMTATAIHSHLAVAKPYVHKWQQAKTDLMKGNFIYFFKL